MNINIISVSPGTDKQVAVGILGNVNLDIVDDNGQSLVKLNGITIRATKDGTRKFLSPPSYKTNDGYNPHFNLFGFKQDDKSYNSKQKASMDSLTDKVVELLEAGGTKRASKTVARASTPAPAVKNPWD